MEAKDRATEGQRTATTILTVNVLDSDDLGPVFSHPLYTAAIRRGTNAGALDIRPDKIQAQDQDSLRSIELGPGIIRVYKDMIRTRSGL